LGASPPLGAGEAAAPLPADVGGGRGAARRRQRLGAAHRDQIDRRHAIELGIAGRRRRAGPGRRQRTGRGLELGAALGLGLGLLGGEAALGLGLGGGLVARRCLGLHRGGRGQPLDRGLDVAAVGGVGQAIEVRAVRVDRAGGVALALERERDVVVVERRRRELLGGAELDDGLVVLPGVELAHAGLVVRARLDARITLGRGDAGRDQRRDAERRDDERQREHAEEQQAR
jgi:hypothetical protein